MIGFDPLQRLMDRAAITDVIHAYCRGVDLVDAHAVASLFTDDCVVDYGPGLGQPTHGASTLEQRLATGLPRFAATSHHVSNIEFDFSDDDQSATTTTYVQAWHRYPDGAPDAVLWARYHDRFVRHGGRWLIAERTLRVAGQQGFDVQWHATGRPEGSQQ